MFRTNRRTTAPAIAIAGLLLLSGCSTVFGEDVTSEERELRREENCRAGGSPAPTVVIVTPGQVPALEDLAFDIQHGGLAPAETIDRLTPGGGGESGIVMIARPDANGDVASAVTFDLREGEGNATQERTLARQRLDCFAEALLALPTAEIPTTGETAGPVTASDLITSTDDVISEARVHAGDHPVTVLVLGMSRSSVAGHLIGAVSWDDATRAANLHQLEAQGVELPTIDDPDASVRFVAPGEGLPAHLRPGVEALAEDLCKAYGIPSRCDVTRGI